MGMAFPQLAAVFAPFTALWWTKDVKADGQKAQFLFLSWLQPETWISRPWRALALASITVDVKVICGLLCAKGMDKNATALWGVGAHNAVVAKEMSPGDMLWCAGISSTIRVGQEQITSSWSSVSTFSQQLPSQCLLFCLFFKGKSLLRHFSSSVSPQAAGLWSGKPFPMAETDKWEQPVGALTHTFINWLPHIVFSWKRERKWYCLFIQWQLKGLVLERRNKNLFNKWVKIERGRKKEWGILAQLSLYSNSSPSPCCQFPILSGWLSLNARSLVNHCAQRSPGLTSIWIAPHFSSFTPTKGSPTIAHN